MTTINYNGNFNYRNKLLLGILIVLILAIMFLNSCSSSQSCLRERDAYKHKKQTQRELNYQFNRR